MRAHCIVNTLPASSQSTYINGFCACANQEDIHGQMNAYMSYSRQKLAPMVLIRGLHSKFTTPLHSSYFRWRSTNCDDFLNGHRLIIKWQLLYRELSESPFKGLYFDICLLFCMFLCTDPELYHSNSNLPL